MENSVDAEDMVQETFLKLISSKKQFESEEHEKVLLGVDGTKSIAEREEDIFTMEQVLQFLKDANTFYIATVEENQPRVQQKLLSDTLFYVLKCCKTIMKCSQYALRTAWKRK